MFAKPQSEHEWLKQLLGEWNMLHDCQLPDGSKSTTTGKMTCRSLGGLWLICESNGESEGESWTSIMTLGFDPAKGHYVGTFVGSMMSNIWSYQGELAANGKRLPLNTVGPTFDGSGTCNYRDTIELVHSDVWLFGSELQDDNGTWIQFMNGKHTRI